MMLFCMLNMMRKCHVRIRAAVASPRYVCVTVCDAVGRSTVTLCCPCDVHTVGVMMSVIVLLVCMRAVRAIALHRCAVVVWLFAFAAAFAPVRCAVVAAMLLD